MTEVRLDCRYRREWPDGFGARGWKLASSMHDPNIIASTPATGDRIPTAVFIHDILDHALCGLPPSGHRAEAIALLQLAARTGADPRPDFAQMVDEDLLQGQTDGEALATFLPADLMVMRRSAAPMGRALMDDLIRQCGREALRARLVRHLFDLGEAGLERARAVYRSHGLDDSRRGALGMALQRLFEKADQQVVDAGWGAAKGVMAIDRTHCHFRLSTPRPWNLSGPY
ncbi:MAG: hypothetical protein K9L70_04315 [Thiohalocapsa sp.]|nr:hypothetical protein [Thiohalocapsa sp.]MCF7991832.1 hypothetical protein [Thiohalocapsa sp.]